MPFLYALNAHASDQDLARAELWVLTGCQTTGMVAESPCACDISRSSFVSVCGEVLAEGDSLAALCAEVTRRGVGGHAFRVDVRHTQPRTEASPPNIPGEVARVMRGNPDLDNPRERFEVLCQDGWWALTRVLSRTSHGYHRQGGRPENFSFALGVRYARVLVNLAAAPGDLLLDPCCGVGTCVVEALHMGIRATGYDVSKPAVYKARENLTHFGLPRDTVTWSDGREVRGDFDAAVLDFPYGHSSHPTDTLYAEILNNVAPQVFRIAAVTGEPADDLFAALGLPVLHRAQVAKGSLVRHFYLLAGLRAH